MSEHMEPVFKILPLDSLVVSPYQCHFEADTVQMDELVESIRLHGVLEPILVREKSDRFEVVMGDRRVKATRKAGLTKIPAIIRVLSDVEALVLQSVENFHRKDLSEPEKTEFLAYMALMTGWDAKEIAEQTGMSERWVYRYLPAGLKNRAQAEIGALGGQATAEAYKAASLAQKSQETINELAEAEEKLELGRVQCKDPACLRMFPYSEIQHLPDGTPYCRKHFPQRNLDYMNEQKRLAKAEEAKKRPVSPQDLKTWEQRDAERRVQHSQMEEEMRELFMTAHDVLGPVLTDQTYALGPRTTPDFVFSKHNLAVYLDGKAVHAGKEDRDQNLREQLTKEHGLKVLSITYASKSEAEKQRILNLVKEAV